MAKIKVNDEVLEVSFPLTVSELLKQENVLQPEMVTVQINANFVAREEFDKTLINEGDEIDFLYFMGGGSV